MLESLFGNKNIQKILLFLFVNGKCYGTQLHRSLHTALTPLQKALLRLEKGGVIISYFEGKTKLYQFNQAYPLIHELEQLLKRAYTLLPANEKKNYFLVRDSQIGSPMSHGTAIPVLLAFWEKLMGVKALIFSAKTKSNYTSGWNGNGSGDVIVSKPNSHILVFNEKGTWKGKQGSEVGFSNVFRWTLDRQAGVISLEHLRHGLDRPVFLFYLAPASQYSLSSVDSHLCGGDTYFGQIHFDRFGLRLKWRVIGPKKNEEIDYYYS
jgi:hypothetical protein